MDLDAIAGVSLKPPQTSYELVADEFGRILLTRPTRWNLSDATLRIEPVATDEDPTPTPVVFSVGPWIPQDARGSRDHDNLEGERELLVDHALLSHPELVTVNETPSSDGLSVAATTALDRLRKRWSNIVEASRDLYRWSPITCEECLRNRRVTDGRFAGRGMYSASGREPCPHTTVGSQALRSLCEAHGELVFELVQWLVPSTVVQSFGEVILPPRRFVLHHELMTALVAQWLLGRSRDAWRQEWLRGYRPNPTTARTHYVRRSHRASGTLDSQTHAAVRFAADAWGIENDTEVERLFALRDPDEADHPAPRLRTDPDIAERIESARVLPEEPAARIRTTEPPPARAHTLAPPPKPVKRAAIEPLAPSEESPEQAQEAAKAAAKVTAKTTARDAPKNAAKDAPKHAAKDAPKPSAPPAAKRGRRKAEPVAEAAPAPAPKAEEPVVGASPVKPPSPSSPPARKGSKRPEAKGAKRQGSTPLSESIQDFSAALASLARMTRGKQS